MAQRVNTQEITVDSLLHKINHAILRAHAWQQAQDKNKR